jgi:hypothetical protein
MSHVPDRANHPNRTGFLMHDPGIDRLFAGITESAPTEKAEPTEPIESSSGGGGGHYELFSWDNPNHYANDAY